MPAFRNKTFNAGTYALFRPEYPKKLLDYIIEYYQRHAKTQGKTPIELTVDVACGTGKASRLLTNYSHRVVGLDYSEAMVDQARQTLPRLPNLEFRVGDDTTLIKNFEPNSVDLVAVAEGAHWFHYPEFWKQCAQVLRPGGTLAIWGYWTFAFPEYPEVAALIDDFYYGESQCRPYWDEGREILSNEYRALAEGLKEQEDFTDIEYRVNHYDALRPEEPFELIKEDLALDDVIGMLGTTSAYYNFKEANPDHIDLPQEVMKKITEMTGLTREDKVLVKWNTVYLLATKQVRS